MKKNHFERIFITFYLFCTSLLLFANPLKNNELIEIHNCKNSYSHDRSHEIVSKENYSLCYCENFEQSEWVSYELTKEELIKNAQRSNNFKTDYEISTISAFSKDYTKSGYDRGHLAPAADMSFSEKAMNDSFLMSNISPQCPDLNRKLWKNIEEMGRDFAQTYGSVLITTGPILDKEEYLRIGTNKVAVPEYFYKIFVMWDEKTQSIISKCYLVPNSKTSNNPDDYITTLSYLESITNIDFYPLLNDLLQ